ncbi:hypothetical protein M758_3G074200 [Ceratodon purpureus]|nr:hypothetical protein M758_3G074200 [Ceratodon purpureus]KAG0622135.1 hypothetical protein M758_3G074200 [Ceratodon purpureus]
MFKDNFLDSAINALQDPVPSIRMRACQTLNSLRTVIRLPDDVALLERINHLATQRLNDSNREVVAAARLASDNQKRVFILDRDSSYDHPSAQDEYEKMDKHREDEEWNMLSKEEQEEKRRMDDSLQRLKIESLRKSSADITSGRSSIGATSTSDSSSSNPSKKGSTSKGSVNGALKGISRSGSIVRTKSQLLSSIPPGSAAGGAALPSSGSNSLSAKRGSLPIGQKLSPSSPGPTRKPPSVPSSAPSPIADGAPSKDQVPRRNSTKR